MRLRYLLGSSALLMLVLWTTTQGTTGTPPANHAGTTTLTITGMTCGGCVATVKLKLKNTKGVVAYEVSMEKGEAEVTYDRDLTGPEAIAAAVSETGFAATVKPKDREAKPKSRIDDQPRPGV